MSIFLYPADATDFERNGLGRLEAYSATVREELLLEGQAARYTAAVSVPNRHRLAAAIEADMILKMSTPEGDDLFRIQKTQKTIESVSIEAVQISNDLRNVVISNRAWVDQPLTVAWPSILKAGDIGSETRFSGISDITDTSSMRIVRSNVLAALIGSQDNSVVNRWGGELRRRGFEIDMLRRRGTDRGVVIRYGKNLTGINETVDTSEMYHAVLPSYLTAADQPVIMDVIRSPLYETVPQPRTITMHFGDIRLGEDEGDYPDELAAETEVQRRVLEMWVNGADRPAASCEISFIDLRNTEEYKNVAGLEKILLGDTIRAIWAGNVDIKQRVIAYEWDALRDRYIKIELGSPRRNVSGLRSQINSQIIESIEKYTPEIRESAIDAVVHLNDVYANSMGFYETIVKNEATGAITKYIHDEPELEQSAFIATISEPGTYVWTQTGWNNGQPVWQYGHSKYGNMVMQAISAYRIDADLVVLESGDDAESVITRLSAGELIIRDTIRNGGHNILKNPRFGGTELPDAGHWYSGGTVAGYIDWYGYLTVNEFLSLYGSMTVSDFLTTSLMGGMG